MAIPRKIYVRNNYFFVEQANVLYEHATGDSITFYSVVKGDTLTRIATKNNTTIAKLRKDNALQ